MFRRFFNFTGTLDLKSDLSDKIDMNQIDMNQTFLLLTTAYVLVPGVMIFLTLVMKPAKNQRRVGTENVV